MKVVAELYIGKKDTNGTPDAFVEANDFETAEREINHYILTMVDDNDECIIKYKKEK